jgi:hypothetical protein
VSKINTDRRPAAALATLGAEKLADLIVEMMLPAGTQTEWDSETIERVLRPLRVPFKDLGIAWVGDTGANDEHLKYWLIEEQRQDDPSWVHVEHFIDLGLRNNEQGYVDSIQLIHSVLTTPLAMLGKPELKAELDAKLRSDLITIEDSGYDLDTMHDTLTEWEERAEEYDLQAYAEDGTYWVTNLSIEED